MGNVALRRGGMLSIVLTVDHKLVADAHKFLASPVPPDKEKRIRRCLLFHQLLFHLKLIMCPVQILIQSLMIPSVISHSFHPLVS